MAGELNLADLVKVMSPKLNRGEYVFATVTDVSNIDLKETVCEFRETEGTSIVIERKKADELGLPYDFIASWITLTIHSSLEAVGLTALFSTELAKHQISCNVIAGYFHDHIFVPKKDAEKAIRVLISMSENYT